MLLFYCFFSGLFALAVAAWEGVLPGHAPVVRETAVSRSPEFALSGRVSNEKGTPLPGAIIMLKGTTKVATTNAAGDFLITITTNEPLLELSCLGYQNQTIALRTRAAIAIKLYPVGVGLPLNDTPSDSSFIVIRNTVAVTADVLPAFPGGPLAYRNFLMQNAHYPSQAKSKGASGAVYVSFVVDELGHILNPQVLKGCSPEIDGEALRLVRIMPPWTPGLVQGKPIAVAHTLRIAFTLADSH